MTAEPVQSVRGDIVLKSPAAIPWILLFIGIAGLGYGIYLAAHFDSTDAIGLNDWTFVGLGGVAFISAISAWKQRVVVSPEYITKYWGTTIRRRCSNRDIKLIRTWIPGLSTLVFAGGEKIGISSRWPGEAQALHLFRTLLDAKAGNVSNRDEWLPLVYLAFPPRCLSCREPHSLPQRIHAGWVLAIGHVHVDRRVAFNVPACRTCIGRRRWALFVGGILAIALGVALTFAWWQVRDAFLNFLLLLAALEVLGHVGFNLLPRWANGRFLGIAATKLKSDRTAVRLWFRDRQLELEVRLLTEDFRSKSLADAHAYLKAASLGDRPLNPQSL